MGSGYTKQLGIRESAKRKLCLAFTKAGILPTPEALQDIETVITDLDELMDVKIASMELRRLKRRIDVTFSEKRVASYSDEAENIISINMLANEIAESLEPMTYKEKGLFFDRVLDMVVNSPGHVRTPRPIQDFSADIAEIILGITGIHENS
jgi:hypothetical protein